MPRYTISRNGQTYGPYSVEELQRYLASGHVLPSDLGRTEGAPGDTNPDWLPVSQILGITSAPGTIPAVGYIPERFPPPPNLNWALVLLIDVFTCSLFQLIWNIVLANWFHRINGRSRALPLYIAAGVLIIMQAVLGNVVGLRSGTHGFGPYGSYNASAAIFHGTSFILYLLLALGCWVVRLVARFTFRSELEFHYNTVEPMGLRINPVLTFFFGGIYLQSVLNEINRRKQYARMGAAPNFGPRL